MTLNRTIYAPALAAVLALWSSNHLLAADPQVMPPPIGTPAGVPVSAPATLPTPLGCPACAGGSFSDVGTKTCDHCGGSMLFHKHEKGPYVVTLCPGACFGYFQTQWRKWQDVCPYPYQGVGVSDSPRPPSPVLPALTTPPAPTMVVPPKSDAPIPGPKPVVPKTGDSSKPMSYLNYPAIPLPGSGN